MKQMLCDQCGGRDFRIRDGFRECRYCGTKFVVEGEDARPSSGIALNEDVNLLLKKCKEDPAHARRYANLILDIDPGNKEARKYLA